MDNFEKANTLFPNKNFSTQSNLDNILNTADKNDTIIDNKIYNKKLDKGLSTGGIIAIVIPTVILLVGITILSFISSNSKSPMINQVNNDSLNELNINKI